MLRIIDKNIEKELKKILKRAEVSLDRVEAKTVQKIIEDVKVNGDKAVARYSLKYDGVKLTNFKVSKAETDKACGATDKKLLAALRRAIKNITNYHLMQLPKSWLMPTAKNSSVGLRYSPVQKVGLYVPGGKAAYPSSVLMNVIPAKVAGVEEIYIVTPSDSKGKVPGLVLAAAKELGVTAVFKIGGAQAVAALAYGTKSIPKVDVIAGPGNIYVTLAKKILYGTVGIDKLAGPSESLILADKTADPKFVAADLITQAEHDSHASSLLICNSKKIAESVNENLTKMVKELKRKDIIKTSFKNNGAIIVIKNKSDFVKLTDLIAPEHLQIMLGNAEEVLNKINNAGAIFIGNYSPEVLGDYFAGPNHVLPTGGNARFDSPLGVDDFIKRSSIIHYSKKDLAAAKDDIVRLAENEGLDGHAGSIKIRF